MRTVAAMVLLLMPLALLPGTLFYYDVTPKIATLLAGAALALVLAAIQLDSVRAYWRTPGGRWFIIASTVLACATLAAAARSADPVLAWNGSNWRRFGAIPQIASQLAALAIAAWVTREWARGQQDRVQPIFRAVCIAGIIAALYGIAQYFGWDPIQPVSRYQAGEGPFQIVRPPGPLGHSDYFASFLLWPIFLGIALVRDERRQVWRALGAAAVASGAAGLLLAGSRGAILGLLCGLAMMALTGRFRWRRVAAALAVGAIAVTGFYLSPAGAQLRARAHWIGDEPLGGARFLLWRDTLSMARSAPLLGSGPDTFVAEFPRFQSPELGAAYPDFYHESPHNVWLDILTGQGVVAVLAIVALAILGLAAGVRLARQKSRPALYPALLAVTLGALIAHEFVVFTATNALLFYLGAAILAGAERAQDRPAPPAAAGWSRWAALAAAGLAALFLGWTTVRMVETDWALARANRLLASNDRLGAVNAFQFASQRRSTGVTADLYFSQAFARVVDASSDQLSKIYFTQMAAASAALATNSSEQRQNAWYNLAMLASARGDVQTVEAGLRQSIAASPNWYKPHWALARLLGSEGRGADAAAEARLAVELNGNKDPEVASTVAEILRSAHQAP